MIFLYRIDDVVLKMGNILLCFYFVCIFLIYKDAFNCGKCNLTTRSTNKIKKSKRGSFRDRLQLPFAKENHINAKQEFEKSLPYVLH